MKIKYKIGDLLDAPEVIIIHGCNAQGVMGSGVAKAIRGKYPWAYEAYIDVYITTGLVMGKVYWANNPAGEPFKIIGNAITQSRYGYSGKQYVSYDAIRDCVKGVVELSTIFGCCTVALPMIGAGLGGGDWNVISDIIETESKKAFQPIVYKLGE